MGLDELIAVLQSRHARFPSEIGAFVVLQACEAVVDRPAVLGPGDVRLSPDGSVSVAGGRSASSEEATRSLVSLLANVLVAASAGVPGGLLSLVEAGPSDGSWDLGRFRDELEACLVPLNRGASCRVLARQLRDAAREPAGPVRKGPDPEADRLDMEVDALMSSTDAVPVATAPDPEPARGPVASAGRDSRPRQAATAPAPAVRTKLGLGDPPPSTQPAKPTVGHSPVDELLLTGLEERDTERRGALRWLLLFVGLVLVLIVVVGLARPDVFGRLSGGTSEQAVEEVAGEIERGHEEARAQPRTGNLRVSLSPEGAEVFVLVGEAPVEARDIPVGVEQEFLAIADGFARAVVPASATWSDGPDGPRYELALQADVAPNGTDGALGAARTTSSAAAPSEARGSVRVITSPPGARVYRRLGAGSALDVDGVSLAAPIELLAYKPGFEVKRLTLSASDFRDEAGQMVARSAIALSPMVQE